MTQEILSKQYSDTSLPPQKKKKKHTHKKKHNQTTNPNTHTHTHNVLLEVWKKHLRSISQRFMKNRKLNVLWCVCFKCKRILHYLINFANFTNEKKIKCVVISITFWVVAVFQLRPFALQKKPAHKSRVGWFFSDIGDFLTFFVCTCDEMLRYMIFHMKKKDFQWLGQFSFYEFNDFPLQTWVNWFQVKWFSLLQVRWC